MWLERGRGRWEATAGKRKDDSAVTSIQWLQNVLSERLVQCSGTCP